MPFSANILLNFNKVCVNEWVFSVNNGKHPSKLEHGHEID